MRTFSDLVKRFDGPTKMARQIGERPNTIIQWAARNSIPVRCWQAIVEAAERLHLHGVTLAALAALVVDRRCRGGKPPKAPPSSRTPLDAERSRRRLLARDRDREDLADRRHR
jgi:hypothetical protein